MLVSVVCSARPSRLLRVAAVGCGLAVAAAAALLPVAPASAPQADRPALVPGSLRGALFTEPLADPAPVLRLADGALPGEARFASRRDETGEVAENEITSGALGAPPFFRLVLVRSAGQGAEPIFREAARRAAEFGAAVTRLSLPASLRTRLGTMDLAAAALDQEGAPPASCHVFRLAEPDLELSFSGWLCDDEPDAERPQRIACLIEGLQLAPDADFLPLRVAFREAAAIPAACPATPPVLAAMPAEITTPPTVVQPPPRASRRSARRRSRTPRARTVRVELPEAQRLSFPTRG